MGIVRECVALPDSDKLYVLQVDMGPSTGAGSITARQIVSGLQAHYRDAQQLIGKRVVVVRRRGSQARKNERRERGENKKDGV